MPLHQITLALLLLAILIGAVSQRLRIPYPIALVLAGRCSASFQGCRSIHLIPNSS